MWAKSAGGSGYDYGVGAAAVADGGAVVVGTSGVYPVTFGVGEANETTLPAGGAVFTARFAPDGLLVWVVVARGTTGSREASGISALPDGSVAVAGRFSGTLTFGAGEPHETTLASQGYAVFAARYAPDGDILWAKAPATSASKSHDALGVAGASDGSLLLTGYFGSVGTFGLNEANETSLTSAGNVDVFVARLKPVNHRMLEVRPEGLGLAVAGGGTAYGLSALADGSVLVSGQFTGTATLGGTTFTSSSGEAFVARYAPDGSIQWASASDSDSTGGLALATSVAAGLNGSAVVTGVFTGTTIFGLGESSETALTSAGGRDVFVAAYAPDGELRWAKSAGGVADDGGVEVVAFPDGGTVLVGSFEDTATFGAGDATETSLTSAGSEDVFLARYAADGTLVWARRAGGTSAESAVAVAVDPGGSALVAGWFTGTATFGLGETNETVLAAGAGATVFVARYDAGGALVWAKGGSGPGRCSGSAVGPAGAVFVTGNIQNTSTFGFGETNETTLTSAGGYDPFLACYAGDGQLLWATRAGGSTLDYSRAVAALPQGGPSPAPPRSALGRRRRRASPRQGERTCSSRSTTTTEHCSGWGARGVPLTPSARVRRH